jgi:hypothetical protein
VISVVTPAKAGVQNVLKNWIPAFAGMTDSVVIRFLTRDQKEVKERG